MISLLSLRIFWWWSPYFGHFWWWCAYDHQKTRIASKLLRTIAFGSFGDFTSHNFQWLGASAFAYFWYKSDQRRPSFRRSDELTTSTWIGHIASPVFQSTCGIFFGGNVLKCRESLSLTLISWSCLSLPKMGVNPLLLLITPCGLLSFHSDSGNWISWLWNCHAFRKCCILV